VKAYSKGEVIEAIVQSVDAERERISLSIKAMSGDDFSGYADSHGKGTVVTGTVTAVDARQASVELADGVEGVLKVAEFAVGRTEDLSAELKVGDSVEAMIINVDRRNRNIVLSIKQLESKQHSEALQAVQQQSAEEAGPTTIGDLIKQQFDNKDS
jgi:small subunit ribosomal protein S1